MTALPITHMTLYKHGVGFFQRTGKLKADEVRLSFRESEMNDILKSLTVIDTGKGKVLGVDYATPQQRDELLAGCTIKLDDQRSLRDLIAGLRGRRAALWLKANEGARGLLLGLDELPDRQPVGSSLVSILLEESNVVRAMQLDEIQGVELLDEQSSGDLRFFLRTSLAQDEFRQVTARLTPGEHDLSISYIAPAPTWRVSYRLVSSGQGKDARTLLQGWGIFDNRLEEDLENISLSLVAGMPVSFVYDLYTPFTPQRPVIEEENRVAPGPIEFESALLADTVQSLPSPPSPMLKMMAPAPLSRAAFNVEDLQSSTAVQTAGKDLGELFEYRIATPVSVGRGQSAMVPVLSALLERRKDLLYNGSKFPVHPVATLRLHNTSGLTLERGPVTVLENGEYAGEAVLPFTPAEGEIVVPYAVELGVKISEESGASHEMHSLRLSGALLLIEQWEIAWREYKIANLTAQDLVVTLEHPRSEQYELFDSPTPMEKTAEFLRFLSAVPAHSEKKLRVQERRLAARREELRRQSYDGLRRYMRQGLIKQEVYELAARILKLWEEVDDLNRRLNAIAGERETIYKQQKQIQGNMAALGKEGKEGALRNRYVDELEASESHLKELAAEEANTRQQIARLEEQVKQLLP